MSEQSRVQLGVVERAAKAKRNEYTIRLIDSGMTVTAYAAQQVRGMSVRFEQNDHVILTFASGTWCIIGMLPQFVDDASTAPRLGDIKPGDVFLGNHLTSAGVHVTGGTVGVEAAGTDASGDAKRSAGTYWVPDQDAIQNLCRRFGIDSAAGPLQFLHDDLTGNTCVRMWARANATTGVNGRLARIQMGYHKDPLGVIFSIYTFPLGPDPTAGVMDFDFKLDPEIEQPSFAGQWPKIERKDWVNRICMYGDGEVTYENALPIPSPVGTTPATVISTVRVSPLGEVSFSGKTVTMTTTALQAILDFSGQYRLTSPQVDIDTLAARIGILENALRVTNERLYDHYVQFVNLFNAHTHLGVQSGGSVSGAPVNQVSAPNETMLTSETKLS